MAEWPKLSDVEISRICAVGKTLVGEVRPYAQPVEKTGCETRIGADGKERKLPVKNSAPVESTRIGADCRGEHSASSKTKPRTD